MSKLMSGSKLSSILSQLPHPLSMHDIMYTLHHNYTLKQTLHAYLGTIYTCKFVKTSSQLASHKQAQVLMINTR